MPLTADNFGIYTINLLSTAFNNAVKTDVVLECIGADNIIVVAVEDADSNAAGLIDPPTNRFEFQGDIDVLGDDGIKNGERKTIVRSVRARLFNCAACKGRFITNNNPPAKIALSGSRELKARRRRTNVHFCDADCYRGRLRETICRGPQDYARENRDRARDDHGGQDRLPELK